MSFCHNLGTKTILVSLSEYNATINHNKKEENNCKVPIWSATVLPAKSDSDVMFWLQSYQVIRDL